MSKCPNCGQTMPEKNLAFCGFCGTNLKTGAPTMANEMEAISKSKTKKAVKVNDELANYVPKAPKMPETDNKPVQKFKTSTVGNLTTDASIQNTAPTNNKKKYQTSTVTDGVAPVAPKAPVADNKPVQKFKTSTVTDGFAPVAPKAPVTDNKPVQKFKTSTVVDGVAPVAPKAPVTDNKPVQKFKTSTVVDGVAPVAPKAPVADDKPVQKFKTSTVTDGVAPVAPKAPVTDNKPVQKFKTSTVTDGVAPVAPKAPVTDNKPVQKFKTSTVTDGVAPVAPKAPVTDNKPVQKFKTSTVVDGVAPIAPKAPVADNKPVQKFKTSTVVDGVAPVAPKAPVTDNKPVQKFKTSTVTDGVAPVAPKAPVTDNKPVQKFKTSTVPVTSGMEELNFSQTAPAEAFETGILEEEISMASPVQTIGEVEQKLPEVPNRNMSIPSKAGLYIGLDVKVAKSLIEKAGFKFEVSTKNDEKVARNEIIAQSIPAGEEVKSDTVIKLTVSCGTWSQWSDVEPTAENCEVETKTEYRTRTREKTIDRKTSTSAEVIKGYTLYDNKKGYGDWQTEKYFTNISKKTSEICELVENLIGFKYCGWFYKGSKTGIKNSFCTLESALYFNKDTKAADWEYCETISYSNVKESVISWSPSESTGETPAGDKVRSNIRMTAYKVDGKEYPLKYGSFETQWYKYKSRTMEGIVYYFEKEGYTDWSLWGKWSEKSEVPTEFLDVETRVLYRSRVIADEK